MDVLEQAKESLFRLDIDAAVRLAEDALAQENVSSEAYFFRAHLYAHFKEDYTKANELLDEAQNLAEDPFPIYRARAIHAMDQGHYTEAEKLLISCRDLKPDHVEVLTLLGETYLHLDQHEQGQQVLREAVRENPFYARANRLLHRLYVEQGHYPRAFDHWKLDNGIDDSQPPIGTILIHYTAMDTASRAAESTPNAQNLQDLADSYWRASLFEEAATVLKQLLEVEPQHTDAKEKIVVVNDYLAMLNVYEKASITIYRSLAQGKRDAVGARQQLYGILRSLSKHYPSLAKLPEKCTKKSWETIRSIYLQEFGLVIKCFFAEPNDYGTYVSYLVNERYFLLDPGYNRAKKAYREVARDVVINYRSWAPAFFAAGTAGWTDSAGMIYRCTDRFRAILSFWIAKQDQLDLDAALQKLHQELADTQYGPMDVFHSSTLAHVFRSRFIQMLRNEAEHLQDPLRRRRHFLRRCYEASINVSLVDQDSQSAAETWNLFPKLKIFILALRKGFWSYRAGFIYRSLINELRSSETPFFSLQRIMTPEISSSRLHGQASRRLFQDMVQHIAENRQQFPGIDPTKNVMLQLGRLNASQLQQIAQSLWR